MEKFLKNILLSSLVWLFVPAIAMSRYREPPTFYLDLQYGLSTTKSKLVGSNDTGSSLRYGLGSYAGRDGQFGFRLFGSVEQTRFELNDSLIQSQWQDTMLSYFFGYFYLSVMLSRVEIKVKEQGLDILDAAGSGYGFGGGMHFTVGKSNLIYFDVFQVSVAELKNTLEQKASIPQRMELDLGARIAIWERWLDLNFGFRMQQLGYKTIANFRDASHATYLGWRFSLYF
ncbi:MAG: hypothetical protein ACOH5I_18575 [Oligoflexus sp.]